MIWVPVVGNRVTVCAGGGNTYPDMEWEIVDHYPIPSNSLMGYTWQGAQYKIMTVEGNSMEPLIQDGEGILFAENLARENGTVCVVSWHGKLIVRGIRINNSSTILVPMNKEYPEIHITSDDEDFFILGQVIKAIPKTRDIRGMF